MRVYATREIRNVAVVGHGASGKTSLVDALAFVAGSSKRHGSVKDGSALTDYTPDEIERKYSINLAIAVAEWMDTKINLLDTPGYSDFQGEAIAGLHAADGALVVVSATSGVEVGTKRMFDEAIEEMQHANQVIDRILFLDGVPEIARYDVIKVGKDPEAQIRNSLELESKGQKHYNEAIKVAVAEGDNGSRELMTQMLVETEHSIDWCEAQLDLIAPNLPNFAQRDLGFLT